MTKEALEISHEELLNNLELIQDGKLTRAGVLLFHHNLDHFIINSFIKIGYFDNDVDLRYQDEIEGSLLNQADKVVDLIYTKYLKAEITYEGIIRVETYPFPRTAVREAILNAIIHKYYGSLNPIRIRVYSDKIEISNNAVFDENFIARDLLNSKKSKPYNPAIAKTFFRAGLIELWGRGITTILNSCKEANVQPPEYTVEKDYLKVVFRATQTTIQTTTQTKEDKGEVILALLAKKTEMTQAEISETLSMNLDNVKYYIKKLKKLDLVEYSGTVHNGKWIVKKDKIK